MEKFFDLQRFATNSIAPDYKIETYDFSNLAQENNVVTYSEK